MSDPSAFQSRIPSLTPPLWPEPAQTGARYPTAAVAIYVCGCDHVEATAEELPDRCPGHGAGLLEPPMGMPNPAVVRLGASTRFGHLCGDDRCPTS